MRRSLPAFVAGLLLGSFAAGVSGCPFVSDQDVLFACNPDRTCQPDHLCLDDGLCHPRSEVWFPFDRHPAFTSVRTLCVDGGLCVEHPVTFGQDLRAVSGVRPDEVWMVGASGLTVLWDGVRWRAAVAKDAGTLWGVSGSEALDGGFIAAGTSAVMRWTGTGWTAATPGDFRAVSSLESYQIAVGPGGGCVSATGGGPFSPCDATPPAADLRAVLATGPGTAWAAGSTGLFGLQEGAGWSQPTVTGASSSDLYVLARGPSGELWAAGTAGTVLRHQDGSWSAQPTALGDRRLLAMARPAPFTWLSDGDAGVLYRQAGDSVSVAPLPAGVSVLSMWHPEDGGTWAVGAAGEVLRHDGQGWRRAAGVQTQHLRGVHWSDAGVFAVGDDSTVLRNDGPGVWTRLPLDAGLDFTAIHSSPTAVWLTTAQGSIHRIGDGGELVTEFSGTVPLTGITGQSVPVVAVDVEGRMLTYSGGSWTPQDVTEGAFTAIDWSGPDGLAVGTVGTAMRYMSSSENIDAGFGGDYAAVKWLAGRYWAVGQGGQVRVFDLSARPIQAITLSTEDLVSVGGTEDGGIYVGTAGGRVLEVRTGQPLPLPTGVAIRSMVTVPGGLIMVGDHGVIVRYQP